MLISPRELIFGVMDCEIAEHVCVIKLCKCISCYIYICMCYIIVLELASCIPYALGHPRTIGVSA